MRRDMPTHQKSKNPNERAFCIAALCACMCVCERESLTCASPLPVYVRPPITLSRRARPPLCKVAVFRLLAGKYGARLDTITNIKNGLLHVASEAGALDVARLLLEEHG